MTRLMWSWQPLDRPGKPNLPSLADLWSWRARDRAAALAQIASLARQELQPAPEAIPEIDLIRLAADGPAAVGRRQVTKP